MARKFKCPFCKKDLTEFLKEYVDKFIETQDERRKKHGMKPLNPTWSKEQSEEEGYFELGMNRVKCPHCSEEIQIVLDKKFRVVEVQEWDYGKWLKLKRKLLGE